jgi:ligand-binding SRPBCC domain-containing protein
MITIRLTTWVNAPVELCFSLARSVEFNAAVASAVHGDRTGELHAGDTVDWSGWRWGLRLSHTSRFEVIRPYTYIHETMAAGGFRTYEQELHFAPMDDGTRVRDEVRFTAPMGPLGLVLERVLLRQYVGRLLVERHRWLKQVAESGEWRKYLHQVSEVPGTAALPEQPIKIAKMQRFA